MREKGRRIGQTKQQRPRKKNKQRPRFTPSTRHSRYVDIMMLHCPIPNHFTSRETTQQQQEHVQGQHSVSPLCDEDVSDHTPVSSPEAFYHSEERKGREKSQRTKKAGGRKSRKLLISKKELEDNLNMNQSDAARCLGVSVSTLKRRFYEIFGAQQRWPYHYSSSVASKDDNKGLLKKRRKSNSNRGNNSENTNPLGKPDTKACMNISTTSPSIQQSATSYQDTKQQQQQYCHQRQNHYQHHQNHSSLPEKALLSHIVNPREVPSEKFIAPETLQTLTEAFHCFSSFNPQQNQNQNQNHDHHHNDYNHYHQQEQQCSHQKYGRCQQEQQTPLHSQNGEYPHPYFNHCRDMEMQTNRRDYHRQLPPPPSSHLFGEMSKRAFT